MTEGVLERVPRSSTAHTCLKEVGTKIRSLVRSFFDHVLRALISIARLGVRREG